MLRNVFISIFISYGEDVATEIYRSAEREKVSRCEN